MNKNILVTFTTLAVVAALIYSSHDASKDSMFEEWKIQFGHRFSADEDSFRKMVFLKNV